MIDSYEFGKIVIDGHCYTSDVIIYPDRVDSGWWRKEGHSLYPEDLKDILAIKPNIIIIGCGASGILKIPQTTRTYIESLNIEFIGIPTGKACELYNKLHKTKHVAAGLHLTC